MHMAMTSGLFDPAGPTFQRANWSARSAHTCCLLGQIISRTRDVRALLWSANAFWSVISNLHYNVRVKALFHCFCI